MTPEQIGLPVIRGLLGLPRERWSWLSDASAEFDELLEPFAGFDPVAMNRRFDEPGEDTMDLGSARWKQSHSLLGPTYLMVHGLRSAGT